MAGVSSIPIAPDLEVNVIFDDDADNVPSTNLDFGPTEVLDLDVDNSAYGTLIYLSLWDAGNPSMGVDAQDEQYLIPASTRVQIIFASDRSFDVGLSWAATLDNGTLAALAPATPPDIRATTLPA